LTHHQDDATAFSNRAAVYLKLNKAKEALQVSDDGGGGGRKKKRRLKKGLEIVIEGKRSGGDGGGGGGRRLMKLLIHLLPLALYHRMPVKPLASIQRMRSLTIGKGMFIHSYYYYHYYY